MNITFEGKDEIMDSVRFSWYVNSTVNEYRVSIDFCGAIDEDGEQNLDASCFADITICETKRNDPALMDRIYNQALNRDIDVTREYDTVMVNAPNIRDNITCRNESSYSDTMMDLSNMFSALTSVLMEYEITKDIDG